MLRRYLADLHVHTVLSPCADYRMVPHMVVERAEMAGLGVLGIADHNSGENAAAVVEAARGTGVQVLPGMEVESREGVHVVALFDDVESLLRLQEAVYAGLPDRENDERLFGVQLRVDAWGNLTGVIRRLLLAATSMSLEEMADQVSSLGGLCVPAHVDRPANGLLGVLGVIPDGLRVPALEVSARIDARTAVKGRPALKGWPLVQSSDAHSLNVVGSTYTAFWLEKPTVQEIAMACRGDAGRSISYSLDC